MLTLQEVLRDFRLFARVPDGERVDLHARNAITGETPLHYMAAMGDRNGIRILVDAGADINAADLRENTPPHAAVYNCQFLGVRVLLELGADRSMKNTAGSTPADLAAGVDYLLDEFESCFATTRLSDAARRSCCRRGRAGRRGRPCRPRPAGSPEDPRWACRRRRRRPRARHRPSPSTRT